MPKETSHPKPAILAQAFTTMNMIIRNNYNVSCIYKCINEFFSLHFNSTVPHANNTLNLVYGEQFMYIVLPVNVKLLCTGMYFKEN